MRHGKIHIFDKKMSKSFFTSTDFDDVHDLVDFIDKFCEKNEITHVDVSVECVELTESEIDYLSSVWIDVIVD